MVLFISIKSFFIPLLAQKHINRVRWVTKNRSCSEKISIFSLYKVNRPKVKFVPNAHVFRPNISTQPTIVIRISRNGTFAILSNK